MITQDSNKHSSSAAGKANQFTNNYNWGFLNIHLSSVGYIGIGFSLIVAAILLAFFCSAWCKKR